MNELRFTYEYHEAWLAEFAGRTEEAERRFEAVKAVAVEIDASHLPALILRCRSRFEDITGVTLPGSFR